MSNVHVLERSGGSYRLVFHCATPAGTNSAGLAWSAVVLKSGMGGATVLPDGNGTGTDGGIATAEKTSILAGTLVEVVQAVDIRGLTGAPLAAFIDDLFAAVQIEQQILIQQRLTQFGRTR